VYQKLWKLVDSKLSSCNDKKVYIFVGPLCRKHSMSANRCYRWPYWCQPLLMLGFPVVAFTTEFTVIAYFPLWAVHTCNVKGNCRQISRVRSVLKSNEMCLHLVFLPQIWWPCCWQTDKTTKKIDQGKNITPWCIGADSLGAMGAIAPTAKKLWGRCPQVAPTGILLCHFFEAVKLVNFCM